MLKSLLNTFKAVWVQRWTRLWAKLQLVGGAILTSISGLNTYITDPTFKSYLDMIDVPKTVTITLAVVGLVALLAEESKNA